MVIPINLIIATVQVGEQYPEEWVGKLAKSVANHVMRPHTFAIYTDKPYNNDFRCSEAGHQKIKIIDIQANGLHGYFSKLKLFDQSLTGLMPFLYLDLTLVVLKDLTPLIELGQSSQASLIGVADWNYPILNSSVLWIRPGSATQSVWHAWEKNQYDKSNFPGDQNFIFKVFQDSHREELAYWPREWISSYKALLKLAAKDKASATASLNQSIILKFHGKPKMGDILRPWPSPSIFFRYPLRPRLWRYLRKELLKSWSN